MKRNSTRAGAAKVHTPLLTCRLSGSPAVLVLYVSRGPTCRLRGPSPLLTLLAIALLTDAVVLETSLQWRVDCFIFSLLSCRVATGISWSPLRGVKGVKPPMEFGEMTRP